MTQTTAQKEDPELVAAIDLGSNSFHMIVCSLYKEQIKTLDSLREVIRLASGLNANNILNDETQQRAFACLERFGQRLQNFPESNVRIVGTSTLRSAKNVKQFLYKAEQAIGFPIHIISGIEEARLIYQGVAHSLQSNVNRRLVIDIGGGSAEYIIGTHAKLIEKASLCMGCVTVSQHFFPDGAISPQQFKKAEIFVSQQFNAYKNLFTRHQWDETIGASGSIKAILGVLLAMQWSQGNITFDALKKLKKYTLGYKNVAELRLPNLNQERLPVFMGGLAILYATFKILNINNMSVSNGALREGLIYDYLGCMLNCDVRLDTTQRLAQRYHADTQQAKLIKATIDTILKQTRSFLGTQHFRAMRQHLNWAAELHEIGRSIAHHQYHQHSAYIIKYGDLAGFSQQDQTLLSTLVLAHRRKIPLKKINELPSPWSHLAIYMAIILRLAVLLQRSRNNSAIPAFNISLEKNSVNIQFPQNWLDNAPLTQADLELEKAYLEKAKFSLQTS